MDTRLLKKIKKNWTIIHLVDPTINNENGFWLNGEGFPKKTPIYRALYKGKKVSYAWTYYLKDLILMLAYAEKYGKDTVFNSMFNCRYQVLKNLREERINKRLKSTAEERAYKQAKTVWP